MNRTFRTLGLAFAWTSLTFWSGGADAQQEFRLNDSDTWEQMAEPDPSTPAGQLAIAQRALAAEEWDRAYTMADEWITTHEQSPMLATAYLVRADAMYGNRDYYDALFDYETIIRLYPSSEAYVTALQRELAIGKMYAGGLKRKLFGLRIVGTDEIAEELLIRVQERLPGSNLAEEAGMELGNFYFVRGQMRMAATAFELFIENYPGSTRITDARKRLIAANLESHKGPEWDAAGLFNARLQLQQLQASEPAAAQQLGAEGLIRGINEKLARKMLVTAQYYLRTGDPIGAEYTVRRLVREHERALATLEALRLVPSILPRLALRVQKDVAPFYAAKRAALLGVEEESLPVLQEARASWEASDAAPPASDAAGVTGEASEGAADQNTVEGGR